MIQSGQASLVVLATETAPDDVSQLLGLVPSETHLKGAPLRSGGVRECHVWTLDVGQMDNTEEDQSGTRALRELLSRCQVATGRVASLPSDCEARIWWSAYSDSHQGGFVIPADLAQQLASLGVDLFGTTWCPDEDK